jgi:hypothetical protein
MSRRSTIKITNAAYEAFPGLPRDEPSKQLLKNHLLEKAQGPELLQVTEGARAVMDLAPEHYGPLGLQVIVYRNQGLCVQIDKLGYFKDKGEK